MVDKPHKFKRTRFTMKLSRSTIILAICSTWHVATAFHSNGFTSSHTFVSSVSTTAVKASERTDADYKFRIDLHSQRSLDRRDFFHSASQKAAAATLALTSVPSSVEVAHAADLSPFPKVYKPPAHSMDGKLVVITGGNTGLGLESAKRLAAAGATVVITSRDLEKGRKAAEEVEDYVKSNADETANGKVMVANLDLCDLDNVKSFKSRLENEIGTDRKVDVLINNAGVMAIPDRRLTKDGFEKTFQTNHLGHFALTATIFPLLAPDARIINVSSMAYLFAGKVLELDNLNGEKVYGPWSSYGLSKLENILFTNELQKRAQKSDKWSSLTTFSLHPGAVQTDLARYLVGEEKFQSMKENGFSSWTDKVVMESMAKFIKTVEEGASTQVYLAADTNISADMAGKFFSDGKVNPVKSFALDEEKSKDLWEVSERLAGIQFKL
ncbi:hypothetical protein ACHAWX_007470 [Stephanocyclus meneghinianus]